jgi:glycine/D-amino acid oxidase-like deaminating enzyme
MIAGGKSVVVFDEPGANRSSAIAAGLFNPITGKLLTKTWMADKIFQELHRFYPWVEKKLGRRFFYPQSIYRPFLSVEEQNEWMGKSADPTLRAYIQEVFAQSKFGHQVHDSYGGILLGESGYLDMPVFLQEVKFFLQSNQAHISDRFDEAQLEITQEGVCYNDIAAKKIILCSGTAIKQSAIASSLPIRLLKGETLEIETEENLELIYNRGVYIVPMHEAKTYRVGATYETKLLTPETTDAGREELVSKLMGLLRVPFSIKSQDWGIRPTTPDRKPILGSLPGYENVVIFNGLGTKGVSLAPYFSGQLMDWMLGKTEIQPEVNINRYKSLFSKSTGAV